MQNPTNIIVDSVICFQVQNHKQMISMQKHKMGCGIEDLRPPEVILILGL